MTRDRRARPAGGSQSGGLSVRVGLVVTALVVVVVAAVLAAGLGLPPFGGDGDGPGSGPTAGPTSSLPPATGPGLTLEPPPPAPAVLAAPAVSPAVSPAGLRRHLTAALTLPGLGSRLAFAVAQLGRPSTTWAYGASTAIPASTLKLLTTTAALSVLGPEHRFTTTVVAGRTKGSLVVVGGGDPLLAATAPTGSAAASTYPQVASLQALADATAARLSSEGVRRVRLGYDASLFTGPAVNPHWPSTYVPENVVSPISALWVNEGRVTAGLAQRSADPARAAGDAFRSLLRRAGVTVVGPVTSQRAPRTDAEPVAAVTSAPLQELVEHVLEQSDNEGAEVLLRQVAVAEGRPGSSVAGVAAVRSALTGLGLDLRETTLYDGSGLSRDNELPAQLLMGVLETASSAGHPELRGVITGLPVAGFSGTLGYRFESAGAAGAAGLGYVRAKTGTLTGVQAYAGLATTQDGQVLVFVAIADRVPEPETIEARRDLDRIAAALRTCGC